MSEASGQASLVPNPADERSEFVITSLPVTDLTRPPLAPQSVIPQFVDGGGWPRKSFSSIPTDIPLTDSIRFNSQAGARVAMTINGQTVWTSRIPLHPVLHKDFRLRMPFKPQRDR
jgi:hypothetical protein